MKRILTLTAALLVSFWCIASAVSGRTLIIIVKSQSSTGIWPNSLESGPFYCTYESSDDAVYIDFMENIGHVSITVSNLSTGETVMILPTLPKNLPYCTHPESPAPISFKSGQSQAIYMKVNSPYNY